MDESDVDEGVTDDEAACLDTHGQTHERDHHRDE